MLFNEPMSVQNSSDGLLLKVTYFIFDRAKEPNFFLYVTYSLIF